MEKKELIKTNYKLNESKILNYNKKNLTFLCQVLFFFQKNLTS